MYGTLDDTDLIEAEASRADIVLHLADISHVASALAIKRGLHSRRDLRHPAYWISVSGTDNIAWKDCRDESYGEPPSDDIYDDWDGLARVLSLPDIAAHHDVEQIQLTSGAPLVKTAIVCPPCIYGIGRGPGNQRSVQIPELALYTLKHGHGFQVGKGLSVWPNVHIEDLSDAFLLLVEEAVKGGGNATWNNEGYYFIENGEHTWGEIASVIAVEAKTQGLLQSAEIRSFPAKEADQLFEFGAVLYGASSRCRAVRARKLLGWKPLHSGIEAAAREALQVEARSL